jgi:thiamine-phosphate pyrophosphorylase
VRPELPRLHAVTDGRVAAAHDLADRARALAAAGGAAVALHARGPELSGLRHFELAQRLSAPPALLFVNDRLDVALAAEAQGVQLGTRSVTPADARRLHTEWWIGVSVHDVEQGRSAQAGGADYLIIGPVFSTPAHLDREPLGVAGFARIAELGLPAVAIGGVTPARAREVRAAGAYGVAGIRAFWEADDPAGALREMLEGVMA